MATTATVCRLAVKRLADLLGRHQRAVSLTMSMLTAAFFPAARRGGFPLHPDRIGRGRLGRVCRVELEPVLKIAEAVLKEDNSRFIGLHESEDRRLKLRRGRLP